MVISKLIAVFIGGGAGSSIRFLLSKFNTSFPYGTFVANIIACLILASVSVLLKKYSNTENFIAPMLMTGLCGGLSTFSTFSSENGLLIKNGQYGLFTLYLISSLLIGLIPFLILQK